MRIFLVNYDLLKKEEHDYEKLWDELKRLDAFKTQFSSWLVPAENTAKEVVDHFKQFVHKDDRLWAVRLYPDTDWYWFVNAIGGTNKWLEKHPIT